jgi:hypothetical protein
MKQLCGMRAESASDDRGFVFTEGAAELAGKEWRPNACGKSLA